MGSGSTGMGLQNSFDKPKELSQANDAKLNPANPTNRQPLSKEATNRSRLVRAQHETRIRAVLMDWSIEAPIASGGLRRLTQHQQCELREMVAKVYVALTETEGRERLAVCNAARGVRVRL